FVLLCFCAASFAAFLYLLQHRELKHKKFGALLGTLPPLEVLDRFTVRILKIGFLFLTLGMVTGIYLAHTQWHGHWTSSPKFRFSVLIWLWYLLLFVVRMRLGWRSGKFFALTALGFLFLLIAFLGFLWMSSF